MDADAEVEARTGVPMEKEAGPRQTLKDLIRNNKSMEELLITLFQYARQPKAKAFLLVNKAVIITCVNNIFLAAHFLVITDVNFMTVF